MLLKVEMYLIDSPTSSGCGASSFLLIPRGKLQKPHKALNMARGRSPSLLLVISRHVRGHRAYTLQERKIHTKLLITSPGHATSTERPNFRSRGWPHPKNWWKGRNHLVHS